MNQERMQWIKTQLELALKPSLLTITDDSHKHEGHEGAQGGAGHYTVEIWSTLFEPISLIQCHRLVYSALSKAIPHEIHALKIKIKKPN